MSKSFTLFQRGELSKSVYTKQIVAIVLLLFHCIMWDVIPISHMMPRWLEYDLHLDIDVHIMHRIINLVEMVFYLTAYILLFTTAINKKVKIATGILGLAQLFVGYLVLQLSYLIVDYIGHMEYFYLLRSITCITLCSGYILVLQNSIIKDSQRSWIALLIITTIFTYVFNSSFSYYLDYHKYYSEIFSQHINWFRYISYFFYCIAIVKFVRCGVFDGKSDEESGNTTNYPIAKYIVGIVVPTALMSLLAYLIITNSSEINSMF